MDLKKFVEKGREAQDAANKVLGFVEEGMWPKVTKIEFRLTVNGKDSRTVFIRKEKIDELLSATDTVGSYLSALRDSAGDLDP